MFKKYLLGTCLQYNVDFKGGSDILGVENVIDAMACQKKCQQTQGCTFFTYQKSLKKCHLKSGQADSDRRTGKPDLISGPRYCKSISDVWYFFTYLRSSAWLSNYHKIVFILLCSIVMKVSFYRITSTKQHLDQSYH